MNTKFLSKLVFISLFCAGNNFCYADSDTTTPDRGSIYVSNVVTAKDVKGDTLTPVDVTDKFFTDHRIYHTIVSLDDAPENTKVKTVWVNAEGKNLGEYELTAGGTRNIDFTFAPTGKGLRPGDYGVDIYINGVYDSTVRFTVVQKEGNQQSGFIDSITMALGTSGDEKKPENETTTFKPSNTFHAVVRITDAPANTRFKASWYLLKSDNGEIKPNTLIDETEITTEGTRNIDFTLKPTTVMPEGTYKVELSVNGVLDPISAQFTVQE